MSFVFTPTKTLKEVIVVIGKSFEDDRGEFSETFRANTFEDAGIPPFVQENYSRSVPLCVRGLHYQLNPMAQGKLVSCVAGRIADVAVDIRRGSYTYGKWAKVLLNEDNDDMLYIPPGFAHGFIAYGVTDAHVIYKVTEYYSPEHDRSIHWQDPDININWECLGWGLEKVKVSDKDSKAPMLKDAENNFIYQDIQ